MAHRDERTRCMATGGMTLARFAGWQCVDPVTVRPGDLALCILHNKEAVQRWRTAKVLVIDEISLLHGRLLDVMNAAAQAVRRNLGVGIQLIGRRLLSASTGGEEVGELGASPAGSADTLGVRKSLMGQNGVGSAADACVPAI